jgi:replicative DNA helicase
MAAVPPIIQAEQIFLAQMMVSGKPRQYPCEFMDPRHRMIYWELGHLQTILHRPGINNLIQHLTEYGKLDAAGGRGYLRELFRNACPPGRRYDR